MKHILKKFEFLQKGQMGAWEDENRWPQEYSSSVLGGKEPVCQLFLFIYVQPDFFLTIRDVHIALSGGNDRGFPG